MAKYRMAVFSRFSRMPAAFASGTYCHHLSPTHKAVWYERNRGLALAIILSGDRNVAALIVSALAGPGAGTLGGCRQAFVCCGDAPGNHRLPMALAVAATPATEPQSAQGKARTARWRRPIHFVGSAQNPGIFWMCNLSLISCPYRLSLPWSR